MTILAIMKTYIHTIHILHVILRDCLNHYIIKLTTQYLRVLKPFESSELEQSVGRNQF